MDPSIKQYADPLYEKAVFESASTTRRESVKYFQERAKTQGARQPFSGVDYQAQVMLYAEHIERVTAARLDSYQKAFSEINRLPTEPELSEILHDFQATWELQIKHSNQALSGSLVVRNAPSVLDLNADLRALSAHGHDRILQEWKIWRGRVQLLQKAASSPEERSRNGVSVSTVAGQPGTRKSFAANAANEGADHYGHRPVAFVSYSWDSETHKKWVFDLAYRLRRKDGVEVILDRWHLQPGGDKAIFMEKSVRNSDFVILVCTPDYARKANGREGGVGYESTIITGELADNIDPGKFIPILRDGDWKSSLPVWIKTKFGVNLQANPYSEEEYESLLRVLHGEPLKAPPVGPKPVFGNSASDYQEAVPSKRAARATQLDQDLKPHHREATRRKLAVARVDERHPRPTVWLPNRSDQSIPAGAFPFGMAFDGANLWVANNNASSVTKFQACDCSQLGTFPVGNAPEGVAFDGANVWVANFGDNTVTKLRASTGAPLGTFAVGAGPEGLAFDGANIWVANSGGNNVSKLRANDGALLGTFAVGNQPRAVAFDGKNIWVTNRLSDNVSKLLASNGALLGTFAVGTFPLGICFDGAHIWVANANSNSVTKLHANDGVPLGSFQVGNGPRAVIFDGNNVWVANTFDNTASVLRAGSGAVVGTFPVGAAPENLAFDGAHIWVSNSVGNSLSKLRFAS